MAVEIELKAHVKDSEALRLLLLGKAQYLCSFEKEDTYYFPFVNSDIPKSGVRLRSESKTFADGAEKKAAYATYKTKEVRGGIEINDEKEFEICSNHSTVTVFDEFLKMLGLKPGYSKRKKGWAFSKEGINAELLELEKLGWFLEMEIVLNDIDDQEKMDITIREAKKKLMDFLSELGIDKDAIESRYYSEMLNEKGIAMSETNYKRPTWDEYFMEVCEAISKRATCDRGRSGCVIAKGNQLLVTGYVGAPAGLPHCDDAGHQFKKMLHEDGSVTTHCVRTVHAEQNAICQAAKRGIPIEGATLYCRMTPCRTCAMLIINCGIERVVCQRRYHDAGDSEAMFQLAGIKLEYVYNETQQYVNQ